MQTVERAGGKHPGAYLRGPIPWSWLLKAHAAGGSSLMVGLLLWNAKSMNRGKEPFKFSIAGLSRTLKLSHDTVSRAVRQLESAGLVEAGRPAGRKLSATLRSAEPLGGFHEHQAQPEDAPH